MVPPLAMIFSRDEVHVFLSFLSFCFLASTEALEFAMTKLAPFGKVQKYIEKLEVRFFLSQNFFRYFQNIYLAYIVMKGMSVVAAGLYGAASL